MHHKCCCRGHYQANCLDTQGVDTSGVMQTYEFTFVCMPVGVWREIRTHFDQYPYCPPDRRVRRLFGLQMRRKPARQTACAMQCVRCLGRTRSHFRHFGSHLLKPPINVRLQRGICNLKGKKTCAEAYSFTLRRHSIGCEVVA